MKQTQAIEGFFLSFNPSEMRYIRDRLTEYGYKQDSEGLKKFILENLEEPEVNDPTERLIGNIEKFIADNPDKILQYGHLAGSLLKRFKIKKAG